MSTITISKSKYEALLYYQDAYQKLASNFASQVVEKPIFEIVENFCSTKKYSKEFLFDLESGLKDLRESKTWKSK